MAFILHLLHTKCEENFITLKHSVGIVKINRLQRSYAFSKLHLYYPLSQNFTLQLIIHPQNSDVEKTAITPNLPLINE
jgi:hypothetical protein